MTSDPKIKPGFYYSTRAPESTFSANNLKRIDRAGSLFERGIWKWNKDTLPVSTESILVWPGTRIHGRSINTQADR